MKIVTVRHAVPSQIVTNDWVIDRVRQHNRDHLSTGDLDLVERRLTHIFERAGTQIRHTVAKGEKAIDFTLAAARSALADSGVAASDVDLLLYVGVCRGWTEPSMASAVQSALGLANATCFDVADACASWLRALQVAHAFIKNGSYRCALIVNCECAFEPYRDWVLASADDVEHRAGGWTAGEAATATIVNDECPDDDFYFVFKNFGEHFGLCMIPLPTVNEFYPGEPDPRYVPMQFFSLSRELFSITIKKIVEVFEADPRLRHTEHEIGFGHEASTRATRKIAHRLRLPYEQYYGTHAKYGNTVSAAVPLGMSLALQESVLRRGQKVLLIVGAAGITVGFASFTF